MRQISWVCTLLFAVFWLGGFVGGANGTEPVRAQDLVGLSQAERITVMKAFLERRIAKVSNVEVTSETRLYNRKFLNGKLGDRTFDGGWWKFHTFSMNKSYRVELIRFPNQAATVAEYTTVTHRNEKTGITRTVSEQPNRKDRQGRIGDEHLTVLHNNRVAFHLLGGSYINHPFADRCNFLLQSLLECSAKWQVDVNIQEQQVAISHPYRIAFVTEGEWGVRKAYFDIVKGMLPVRVDIDYRAKPVMFGGIEMWREERIVMDEPRNFDGFCMPMRIEERIRASTGKPDVCSVYLTNVKQIVFGRVKEVDLEVKFPPGTLVADTIKNVFYRTDADGNPKEPINPIGIPKGPIQLDPQGRLIKPPSTSWMLRIGIWSMVGGAALFPCIIVLRRRWTGRPQ